VLAHPANIENLEEIIAQLQKAGLEGIEVYYTSYPLQSTRYLASLAHKYGLIATGGSDYHGFEGIGDIQLSGVEVPTDCVEQLFALSECRKTLTQ
jgi:3',5'-nucleoside bisphosphate phosphatase